MLYLFLYIHTWNTAYYINEAQSELSNSHKIEQLYSLLYGSLVDRVTVSARGPADIFLWVFRSVSHYKFDLTKRLSHTVATTFAVEGATEKPARISFFLSSFSPWVSAASASESLP